MNLTLIALNIVEKNKYSKYDMYIYIYICNVRPSFPYCGARFGLNMQKCLTRNQTDIELTLKPPDGASGVIRCGDIIVVTSGIFETLQVMHESCSQAFYIRASSGGRYTSGRND